MLYEISVLWREEDGDDRESSWVAEAPAYRTMGDGRVILPPAMVRWAVETLGTGADGAAGRRVYGIDIARFFPPTFTRTSREVPDASAVRSVLAEYRYPVGFGHHGLHEHLARRAAMERSLAAEVTR